LADVAAVITVTKTDKKGEKPDAEVQQILDVLAEYQRTHKKAAIDVHRRHEVSIHMRIIDPDFGGSNRKFARAPGLTTSTWRNQTDGRIQTHPARLKTKPAGFAGNCVTRNQNTGGSSDERRSFSKHTQSNQTQLRQRADRRGAREKHPP
jgi:hypothetical protein